jgi:long-chain acyl-CoA synthetase
VREFSVPATTEVSPDEALPDLLAKNVAEVGDQTGFRVQRGGQWQDVTWTDFAEQVAGVAKGLVASGVAAGDRVALQARTRYEWAVVDFAIWTAGAVTVPIYETSSADQVAWILSDSGATAVIVERDEHASAVESVRDQAPELRSVHVIEDDAVGTLTQAGKDVPDSELEARRKTLNADSLATLIYTSGTTGRPKGCELTHGNFLFEIGNGMSLLGRFLNVDGSILLFIPLAHVLARVIHVGAVKTRTVVGHTPDVKDLVSDLGAFRPTFVLAVPRVFEKVFNTAKGKAEADGKGKIFDKAAQVAIDWSRAQDTGGPGLALPSSTRCSTSSSTASSARPSAAAASARSPAAPRSVTGSATSTAASASPCTRATASPRRPPRRRSTTTRPCASAPSAARSPASTSGSPTTARC